MLGPAATHGVVLCDQTRTVDTRARTFRKLEQVPAAVIEEALDAARSILE
jgi:mRNA interferase ChpB